jgi:hypothetical protein
LITLRFEVEAQSVGQMLLVFDYQHSAHTLRLAEVES